MAASTLPILYSFRRCPYAMRARLAIASARLACELREVSLKAKPAAMIAVSPKATVPVLVLSGGQVLDESLDIMLWALEQQDPEGCLPPPGHERSAMLALIAENDGPFKTQLDRYKYPGRYGLESGAPARDAALPWLRALDRRLAGQSWLFGPRRSLADMAIAPFVRQFAHTDRDWFHSQPLPHLQQWLEAFLASPAFAQVMEKHAPWSPGDEPVWFTPTVTD